MADAGQEHGDGGFQAERTRLAWRRTTLATTIVTLLGLSLVVTAGPRLTSLVGVALVALVWLAILAVAHRRIRTLAEPSGAGRAHPARAPAALALLTTALAVLGAFLTS